jgi:Xaa-Pro aminopeptidase
MPDYPDFPKEEYEQRYARARALMEERGLDGLLITEELNYIYFTGHRSQQNPIDKIRPYIFIFPKDGEGVLITMPFEVGQVRETTWVTDVRTGGLTGYTDLVVSILKEKGLSRGKIGAELGREQYLGINYNTFEDIRKSLQSATFVDAAPIFLILRATKSPGEVEYMRKAAQITATSIGQTYETIHSGMTGIEISRVLRKFLAENGGEKVTFMCVTAGLAPGTGMVSVATERRIRPGDVLVLDTGVEYRGYASDVARSASVGEPKPELAEFYKWMGQVRQRCVNLLRAGARPKDVVLACRDVIAERGLETTGVGRIGHGVGLESTEYPSLAMEEDIVLQEGHILTCNPNFVREFGFINGEDEWLVTTGAPEPLSTPITPTELPIVRVK